MGDGGGIGAVRLDMELVNHLPLSWVVADEERSALAGTRQT